MNTADICRLRSAHLFAGLSLRELESVAQRGTVRRLRKDTVFIEQDDTASSLYLILSGRVKVYESDRADGERLLGIRGPGEHLGELALLTDAVRTASVATLEETELLVLSRRAFVQCLTEFPLIAPNLEASLEQRALSPDIGPEAATRYRAWSGLRRSGLPLIVLIGGCTGTGKSTVVAELALRLDIGRTLSTDILRDVVRLFVSDRAAPELHVSTFEAWRVRNGGNAESHLIDGFRAQAGELVNTVGAVLERSIKENASIIVEGIHMRAEYQRLFERDDAVVVPLLLTNPDADGLKRHFRRRGETVPSRGEAQYLENFASIWRIQEYLIEEARDYGIPTIPNTDLDHTLRQVMDAITDRLLECFP